MHMRLNLSRRLLLATLLAAAGCGRSPALHPVKGRVSYLGKPLSFGIVMFQPPAGGPSTGEIRPDGAFELEIPGVGIGAVAGRHQIIVLCYESQDPQRATIPTEGEPTLGRLLIPARYSQYETSGLTRVVPDETSAPVILELTD
jgi:hypothetical protein